MGWLTSLGLCLAGLAAIIIEFFVPAAGLIGILGFGSMVAGIVLAYNGYGTVTGTVFLIGTLIATPAVIALYFKLFPKSVVGRWLILRGNREKDIDSGNAGESDDTATIPGDPGPYPDLKGKTGKTVSSLRPSGTVEIDGRTYSVVTGGEYIDRGETVIVRKVEGNRITVRKESNEW